MSAPAEPVTMLATFGEIASQLEARDFDLIPTKPRSKAPAVDACQYGRSVPAWLPRYARCGTGLLTRRTRALDIDVWHGEAAEAVDRVAVDQLGDGPLRFGQPPKRMRLCRTEAAFPKIASRDLVLPRDQADAKSHKAEMLADGHQFVAFGIHPDTRLSSISPDRSPLDLERQDLPLIDAKAAGFVAVESMRWRRRVLPSRTLKEKAWPL